MKRWTILILLALAACLLTACGDSAPVPTAVPAPTQAPAAAQATAVPAPTDPPAPTDAPAASQPVDIDLAHMNSTMAQAQITDMTVNSPEKYVGKTVLATGRYYFTDNKRLNLMHHYVLIGDELSCCAQLVEFVLEGGVFPDSYPGEDMPLTVQGVFEERDTQYGKIYAIVTDHLL